MKVYFDKKWIETLFFLINMIAILWTWSLKYLIKILELDSPTTTLFSMNSCIDIQISELFFMGNPTIRFC